MDFTTSDITAIAASFVGESKVHVWLLGDAVPRSSPQAGLKITTTEDMLAGFRALYDEADIVTGHYIRKHDLPIINGALMECGMKPLSPKMSSDTKNDLIKRSGISASQESLADMLGVKAPKYHMTQARWRLANRLTPEGIAQTKKRVVDDIRQHKALRLAMLRAEILGAPRTWYP